jgi:hypothetical protein
VVGGVVEAASPILVFDPGGSQEEVVLDPTDVLYKILGEALPTELPRGSAVVREGQVYYCGSTEFIGRITLDTGANSGNYVGESYLERLPNIRRGPCRHHARLGDGKTEAYATGVVWLEVAMYDDNNKLTDPMWIECFILPGLGNQIIIGLPEILGNFYDFFTTALRNARQALESPRHVGAERLHDLMKLAQEEVSKPKPSAKKLKLIAREAKGIGSSYQSHKRRVMQDSTSRITLVNGKEGNVEVIMSNRYGQCYKDNRVEDTVEDLQVIADDPFFHQGILTPPWSKPPEVCPEEEETPDPLAFGEDILHYLEMSVPEARQEYMDLLEEHVSEDMKRECPAIMELLSSELALDVFVPAEWKGLRVKPLEFTVKPGMPDRMLTKARPIRPELYDTAKKEFERLSTYFYETDPNKCTSAIASPLVIAPKATHPFIRYCGDYRRVNDFIEIPQQPIPIVQHELVKASKYKVFIDLDATNSFHQFPLSEQASNLLSVQTPWGLVRPKFLPEGVGPASGILQSTVREIFCEKGGFEDFIIPIFDNFLVCAHDYEDALVKLQKVLVRAKEYNLILKMKKSWIGVSKVSFFGYDIKHGLWELSQARKDSIGGMKMPTSVKEMQSFLGAALFFHHHIPDFSNWASKLHDMCHSSFSWDPGTWKYDYVGHFDKFKEAIKQAATLYFPDYSLPWVVRTDASEVAVGAVLFQERTLDDGTIRHEPIAFSSKKFSDPATRWDTYKREAYGIYHAVKSFNWYLLGKEFVVETDHRNLVWIETSDSPIVIRWRTLLQAYHFKIRHIKGSENRVADWISRSPFVEANHNNICAMDSTPTFEEIMRSVHGGRSFHSGVSHTWKKARETYPTAHITMEAVREWVKNCPMCQKTRDVGIEGLRESILTLKPDTYRRRIGVDHVTVTPADEAGNTVIILLVEHWSHFPQAYAAKDYTAETVAATLFEHTCTFGLFDELASDPGSAFMSEVVGYLLKWLGINHKISLVGRHESNGCEASGREFLRHLRTLVLDERLKKKWSSNTVLPLINFYLCSYPTSETGGYTPFQLKYGTQDAAFFKLPSSLDRNAESIDFLRRLDKDLSIVRELSQELQDNIVRKRQKDNESIPIYLPGDFILWNSRENPCDHLPEKLTTAWKGPYEVVKQTKNDIECTHVVLGEDAVVHVSRVKPFFGTREEAEQVAMTDKDQVGIVSIDWAEGNPYVRTSMRFGVTWVDGFQTIDFNPDLAASKPFHDFVLSQPYLFPLRFTREEARKEVSKINKNSINSVIIGETVYLSLRYFDGTKSTWYDNLSLPDRTKSYVAMGKVISTCGKSNNKLNLWVPIFNDTYTLTTYEVQAYISKNMIEDIMVEVTTELQTILPQIWG